MTKVIRINSVSVLIIPCLLGQVTLQVNLTTYKGSETTLDCSSELGFDSITWIGPPRNDAYYSYPDGGFATDHLGDKVNRLAIASNFSLLIKNTQINDGGDYRCTKGVRTNSGYQINHRTTVLVVHSRTIAPVITASVPINERNVLAEEDQPVIIYCVSRDGYPASTVILYKGSESLGTSTVSQETDLTYTVTLTYMFTPKRSEDRGQLVCRSYWPSRENSQVTRQANVSLYLYLKPNQPILTSIDPVVTGSDVSVECRTSGSRPAANISWTIRGETLGGVTTVTPDTSTETFTTVSVLQRRVTSADNGHNLTCKVSHKTGERNNSTILNILFPPTTIGIEKQGLVDANGSNNMTMTCVTGSSNPAAVVTWSTSIINTSTIVNSKTSGLYGGTVVTSMITFAPTREYDGLAVSCTARNSLFTNQPVFDNTTIDNIQYSPLINTLIDQTVVEGDNVALKCTASSKPVASFRWANNSNTVAQGSGTASYNGLDYNITAVSRTQAGAYTCTADNKIPPNNSRKIRLVVQYPPVVVVNAINTTVHNHSTTLTCGASGVPDNYTYEGWMHTFDGVQVLHPEPLPASRNLTLTGLSYAHSGVYRCGASNGINGASNDEGTLLVQSFPIFIGGIADSKEIIAAGPLMKPTVITFQYYSNAGSASVKVLKVNGSGGDVGEVYQNSVSVTLPVFLSEVTTLGTQATINITTMEQSRFGEYQIIVKNDIGSVNLSLIIRPLGRPETPKFVNSTVLNHHSVIISWISGFHNGFNQTFVIQISTDNSTWQNITQVGDISVDKTHTQRVDNLASNQLYFVRILSKNEKGESQPTGIFNFQTEASPDSTSSPIGLIAGGAAGGSVAALLLIAVNIFIVWRMRGKSPSGKAKDTGALVVSRNLNPEYDDGDEEVENPAYVSAGPRETNMAVGVSGNKQDISSYVVYATPNNQKGKSTTQIVSQTNEQPDKDLYAVPDKSKGQRAEKNIKEKTSTLYKDGKKQKHKIIKTTPQTGDVYENAPNTMFGNKPTTLQGESVYEDTNIDTSSAPKVKISTKTVAIGYKPTGTDGLLYADLAFAPRKKGPTKIIGKEDRCEYTTIDLTKKAQPLQESDDEDKTKE